MKLLKELRDQAGMTLRQVEEATNISNAYLSQLENGKIMNPSTQTIWVLAKLYCVDPIKLLTDLGIIKDVDIKPATMRQTLEKRIADLEERVSRLETKGFLTDKFM